MVIDGYVRVSQVRGRSGERFISPVIQRNRIEGWARLHGAQVGRMFEEPDESGARPDRPLLEQAIRRVETGVSHSVVVAKLDRFGRSLMHGLTALDRVQRAGGIFVSVDDGFDLRTDTGRLIMRIMLAMGEWQLDRIRENWNVTRERVIARGVHMSGITPAGYRRAPSGHLVPDEHGGPIVTAPFVRRARGESLSSLCRWLESQELRTGYGNLHWGVQSTRGVLANRAYLGEARSGVRQPERAPAAHRCRDVATRAAPP
jgi:DNA invertase Pin-like site-specific DNA recombinase